MGSVDVEEEEQSVARTLVDDAIQDIRVNYQGYRPVVNEFDVYETHGTERIGTDGKGALVYNPDFIMEKYYEYGDEVIEGLICHEILHCVNQYENESYNHHIMNVAEDMWINDVLINEEDMTLPEDGIIPNDDRSFRVETDSAGTIEVENIDQKSMRELYNELYDQIDKNRQQGDQNQSDEELPDELKEKAKNHSSQQNDADKSGDQQSSNNSESEHGDGQGQDDSRDTNQPDRNNSSEQNNAQSEKEERQQEQPPEQNTQAAPPDSSKQDSNTEPAGNGSASRTEPNNTQAGPQEQSESEPLSDKDEEEIDDAVDSLGDALDEAGEDKDNQDKTENSNDQHKQDSDLKDDEKSDSVQKPDTDTTDTDEQSQQDTPRNNQGNDESTNKNKSDNEPADDHESDRDIRDELDDALSRISQLPESKREEIKDQLDQADAPDWISDEIDRRSQAETDKELQNGGLDLDEQEKQELDELGHHDHHEQDEIDDMTNGGGQELDEKARNTLGDNVDSNNFDEKIDEIRDHWDPEQSAQENKQDNDEAGGRQAEENTPEQGISQENDSTRKEAVEAAKKQSKTNKSGTSTARADTANVHTDATWAEVLKTYFQEAAADSKNNDRTKEKRMTMAQPRRDLVPIGVYRAGEIDRQKKDNKGQTINMAVSLDQSGSIRSRLKDHFLTTLQSVLKSISEDNEAMHEVNLALIPHDEKILTKNYNHDRYSFDDVRDKAEDDEVELDDSDKPYDFHEDLQEEENREDLMELETIRDGGGTSHQQVLSAASMFFDQELDEKDDGEDVLLAYTDGYTNVPNPQEAEDYNVIWVMPKGNNPFSELGLVGADDNDGPEPLSVTKEDVKECPPSATRQAALDLLNVGGDVEVIMVNDGPDGAGGW